MDKTQVDILFGVLYEIKDIKAYHGIYEKIIEKLVSEVGVDLGPKQEIDKPSHIRIAISSYNGIGYELSRTTDGHYSFLICNPLNGYFKSYDQLIEVDSMDIRNDIPGYPHEVVILSKKGEPLYEYEIDTKDFRTYAQSSLKPVIDNINAKNHKSRSKIMSKILEIEDGPVAQVFDQIMHYSGRNIALSRKMIEDLDILCINAFACNNKKLPKGCIGEIAGKYVYVANYIRNDRVIEIANLLIDQTY